MAILGKAALDGVTLQTQEIQVPSLGGSILIRKLTATEVTKLGAMANGAVDPSTRQVKDPDQMARAMAHTFYLSWVDEDGKQVLTGGRADIDKLIALPFEVLSVVNDAVTAFNGMGDEPSEAAKKNSEPITIDDFGIN